MTLRHMKILVEVYRQNSVTKAAQALHLSQPSVSLALRELEDYYGVTLFERVGRRISPTECGREFYGYAVHVVSLMVTVAPMRTVPMASQFRIRVSSSSISDTTWTA